MFFPVAIFQTQTVNLCRPKDSSEKDKWRKKTGWQARGNKRAWRFGQDPLSKREDDDNGSED